ncbi:DUF2621 family protein [Clostridium botulinum]|uniref:DUF2621 family protein n=1 Tax=Clostridium botulinum TaxID=1491 RepID=A0A6M0SQ81_CLOBO|nr:DUF2621 family protein [Clostridium botulinum]
MRLEVGTNFDNELFNQIKGLPVSVIYGKLTEDIVGGGRPSLALPRVDIEKIKRHIELAHENGIEFNYLLNAACLDNLELTAEMNSEIIKLLDLLNELKVDWVTVTIPYLIELVKKRLPNVKVSVSAFANVDSIQKAKHYERLGVDEITIPESYNRNFKFLKELRKNVNIDIRLIATNDCLLSCPFQHFHPIYQSHASQSGHVSGGFAFDYCLLRCTYERLKDPSQFIKSGWIRPEDLEVYEEMGYDNFKLTERLKKTDQIVKMVKAYSERKWNGNLAEILNVRMSEEDYGLPNFEYIDKPEFADFGKMSRTFRFLFKNKVYIDNNKLSGFINFFKDNDINCLQRNCDDCQYCKKTADKAIKIDNEQYDVDIKEFKQLFNEINTGAFFKKEEKVMKWQNDVKEIFDKMMELKPEFIREVSSKTILADAEEIARKRNSNEVSVEDIIEANFNSTPKEIHPIMIGSLQNLGLNVDKYIEQ